MEDKKEARDDFKKWVLLKEISCRQKLREVWLKESDETLSSFIKWPMPTERGTFWLRLKLMKLGSQRITK